VHLVAKHFFRLALVITLPVFALCQDEKDWPPLAYLKSDYKSVAVVAHVAIRDAEITAKVGGYENWKVSCEVLESFKGRLHKGDVLEYFQGVEAGLNAGLNKEYFSGDKIVFLLTSRQSGMPEFRYSALENSSLPYTETRAKKLRTIQKSFARNNKLTRKT
jgi:hypothetical protein